MKNVVIVIFALVIIGLVFHVYQKNNEEKIAKNAKELQEKIKIDPNFKPEIYVMFENGKHYFISKLNDLTVKDEISGIDFEKLIGQGINDKTIYKTKTT